MRAPASDRDSCSLFQKFGASKVLGDWLQTPRMMKLSRGARACVGVRLNEERLWEAMFFRGAREGRFVVAKERVIEGSIGVHGGPFSWPSGSLRRFFCGARVLNFTGPRSSF